MLHKKLSELEHLSKEKLSDVFKYIFDEYKNLVYYVIIQKINIPYLAEEILNDTFLILYQHWNEIKDKTKIKSYLTTTAKRLAIKQAKAYTEESKNIDYLFEINHIKATNDNNYDNGWLNLIDKFKSILTPDDLDLLIKSIYCEYKVNEIAKDTGVNVFTVATRIRRLKIKLRKYYEKQK